MIQLQNISLAFGGQVILNGINWTIKPGQRIGLIGPNGAGKTTIMRLIAGRQTQDDGTISINGGMTIGYLSQDTQEVASERSVLEEAMLAFAETLALQAEEERITQALSTTDHTTEEHDKLLHALDRVHAELITREAHLIRPRTEAVLAGLGFSAEDQERPLHTFSGGWRMRVALARILLRQPDFLFLDEPTNHLDIVSIDWLEAYLKSYPGTVIIVSHDRYFLDRMVTSIVELVQGSLTEYAGNYAFYLEERVLRRELQQAAYDNQQRTIAEMERFVERFKAKATKAKQAQSRVKMLEKMDRVVPPPTENARIAFRFPEPRRSGRVVLELSAFSKTYDTPEGPLRVFQDAGPLVLERGDKVALIGKNGAGKSTLARILRGTEPFDGERAEGYQVDTTYFAQHQAESLNPDHTVLDALREVARGHTETTLRSLLGAFLFSGDDAFKKVSVLSGGEKSRLALARTLLHPANFLILDEPTNHLDIQSITVLIEALQQYTGSFLVVSHDRHFIDQITNKVWYVGEGKVRQYTGNYTEYLWQVAHGTASRLAQTSSQEATPTALQEIPAEVRSGGPKTKEQKRLEAEERSRRYQALQQGSPEKETDPYTQLTPGQLRKAYEKLEAEILTKEEQKVTLERTLGDPDLYADTDRVRTTTAQYDALREELEQLYERWEAMAEHLS